MAYLNLWIGLGFLGVMAFLEHLIHRAGHFLAQSEWERWRALLPYDRPFVSAALFFAVMPVFCLMYRALRQAFPNTKGVRFAMLWLGYVLVGLGLLALARVTA